MIQSLPSHNVGDQKMSLRMAANAIWNKLNQFLFNFADESDCKKPLRALIIESKALAHSIVMDDESEKAEDANLESKFCYVDIDSPNCDGWLNLFWGDHCLALVSDVFIAEKIRRVIPKKKLEFQ